MLKIFIFPPKNLEKIRCLKYACAVFFFNVLYFYIYLIQTIKVIILKQLLYSSFVSFIDIHKL